MNTQRRAANALGGKTARACDSCLRKRARWFCTSDDAFLCQACDASVHSANLVASRHERVRLETASSKTNCSTMTLEDSLPAWQGGFTKKARTSRNHGKSSSLMQQSNKEGESMMNVNAPPHSHLVPELSSEETSPVEDDDEQILFRVPVFDPFETDQLCNMSDEVENIFADEVNFETTLNNKRERERSHGLDDFSEFLPSDMDLAELAADVENLLGDGIDEEFGLENCKSDGIVDLCFSDKRVKVEEDAVLTDVLAPQMDSSILYCSSQVSTKEEEPNKVMEVMKAEETKGENEVEPKKKMFLKLNYEAVLTAWGCQSPPWTTGNRPQFSSDDCWPDLTGISSSDDIHQRLFGAMRREAIASGSDSGREARVSRYREKRRTRLFSKKIRYEVRKLNAEKRPRIKGRFVKRTSLYAVGPSSAAAAATTAATAVAYPFYSQ